MIRAQLLPAANRDVIEAVEWYESQMPASVLDSLVISMKWYQELKIRAVSFLLYFGLLYFADGLMGLITGSGYLDLGIINYGWQSLPLGFKILA